ncbi:hypothetical protein ACFQBN_09070 [Cohnella cellulosilytica]
MWQLGRHRLMCGDATDQADVEQLMDRAKAALVVTDPPYNVAIESVSERLVEDGRGKIMNDDMPAEDFAGFCMPFSSDMPISCPRRRRSTYFIRRDIRQSSKKR